MSMILEDEPVELPCSVVCCEDEWKTYTKVEKSRIPPVPLERAVDIEEPIRVFLFEEPKRTYGRKVWASAIYTAANFVIGGLCVVIFMYGYISGPYCGDMYSRLSKKMHLPLESVGIILHGSLGMMVFSDYYDSSHMIKWKDKRDQHEKQMFYSILMMITDIAVFFIFNDPIDLIVDMTQEDVICPCDKSVKRYGKCVCPGCTIDYNSVHVILGIGAFVCYAVAAVTGILLYLFLGRGAQGSRGKDTLVSDFHTVAGLAAYLLFLVTFCSPFFIYARLKKFMKRNYGPHLEIMIAVLAGYLFFAALISPGLRLVKRIQTYRAKKKFREEANIIMKMEEMEQMKKRVKALREKNEKKKAAKKNKMKTAKRGKKMKDLMKK